MTSVTPMSLWVVSSVAPPPLTPSFNSSGGADLVAATTAGYQGNVTHNDTAGAVLCGEEIDLSIYDYPYTTDTWKPFTWRQVLKLVCSVVMFVVSLVGNVLVIMVVCYNPNLRSSTNQYLVNLAVADLLVTLMCMWVHVVRHHSYHNYILPAIFCKMESFMQATCLLASVFTLTAISVGRFVAVKKPLQAHTRRHRVPQVLAVVWLASALISCPMLFYRRLYSTQWANMKTWSCDEIWPTEYEYQESTKSCVVTYDAKQTFYIILIIAFYFVPVAVMFFNYSQVVWTMWVTQAPGEQSEVCRAPGHRAKKRVVKMVTVVLLVFVLCWTPLQSLILYACISSGEVPPWFGEAEFAAYFVAHSNSALNPIIYCGFTPSFRQGLKALLSCRRQHSSRMYHRRNNWHAMTGRTRDTTLGSGPEPVMLLQLGSLRGHRVSSQRWCVTPPTTGGLLLPTITHNTACDANPDLSSKNWCGDGDKNLWTRQSRKSNLQQLTDTEEDIILGYIDKPDPATLLGHSPNGQLSSQDWLPCGQQSTPASHSPNGQLSSVRQSPSSQISSSQSNDQLSGRQSPMDHLPNGKSTKRPNDDFIHDHEQFCHDGDPTSHSSFSSKNHRRKRERHLHDNKVCDISDANEHISNCLKKDSQ